MKPPVSRPAGMTEQQYAAHVAQERRNAAVKTYVESLRGRPNAKRAP
jgi:hypothetical protein